MNDLILLAQKYPNLNVTIGLAVLLEFGRFLVDETKQQLEQTINDEKAEMYFSPNKTAELLSVDLSTLWRWNKRGYLTPITVGGKRRYLKSDIDKILMKGEKSA